MNVPLNEIPGWAWATAIGQLNSSNHSDIWLDVLDTVCRHAQINRENGYGKPDNAAKPAQVGQKYRPVTIEDAKVFARQKPIVMQQLRAQGMDAVTRDHESTLAALQSIGAVVPAQDGGA